MDAKQITDFVNEWLSFDEGTGFFTWKKWRGGHAHEGVIAGRIDSHGYRQIRIFRKPYFAHRLVWVVTYGEWPHGDIDHINGQPDDNRPSNLRIATRSENAMNRRAQARNLPVGVSRHKGRFCARIEVDGHKRWLGYFVSPEDAGRAYQEAARNLFGEFNPHEQIANAFRPCEPMSRPK